MSDVLGDWQAAAARNTPTKNVHMMGFMTMMVWLRHCLTSNWKELETGSRLARVYVWASALALAWVCG